MKKNSFARIACLMLILGLLAPVFAAEEMDIWVLAGQSNMGAGRSMIPGKQYWATEKSNPRIKAFENGQWVDAVPGKVGPGFLFARHIVENTSRSIGLIFCARGNTSILDWKPPTDEPTTESLYRNMINLIRAGGGKPRGVLWAQGENDASLSKESIYEQELLNLVDSIRKDTGIPDLPFVYLQLSRFYAQGLKPESWEAIREIQRHAALKRKNMFMASAIDVPLSDLVHIAAEGQTRWARRLGEIALSEVYHQPNHGKWIRLDSIKVEDRQSNEPRIKVHFSGVNGRLKADGRPGEFELRTENPTPGSPTIYRTDFDPNDPAGLILRVMNPLTKPAKLVYGAGSHPYCNVVDEKDIALPTFGPVDLPLE